MPDVAITRNPSSIVVGTTGVSAGASAGESFPSMESVNSAYSHYNQAVALYNRRTNQCMSSPDVQAYFSPGNITASGLNSLRTKIDTLRSKFGLSAFSYTYATRSPGDAFRKKDVDELFSALNFSGNMLLSVFGSHIYLREDIPSFGTFSSDNDSVSSGGSWNAGTVQFGAHEWDRYRTGISYSVPSYLASLASTVAITQEFDNFDSFTTELWLSNTDDSGFPSGWWNHFGTSLGAFTASTTTVSLPLSAITSRAGGHISYLVATPSEKANTNASDFGLGALGNLKIDFGF